MAAERRALVIAYFFPPLGGAGVQRTLKFVKYLPEFGWRSTVISTRSRIYHAHDADLRREIPAGTRVLRVPALPAARWLVIALGKLGLRRLQPWVAWPDGGIGWMPAALAAALREARRDPPDVIYSTSSPYGCHLVALALHRLTGIPWVADFRDEWASNPHSTGQPRLLARLDRAAERATTAGAKRIVVAADYFQLDGAPSGDGRRSTIPNGVDPADLAGADGPAPPSDRFRLSFVGTLYGPIDLVGVLRALELVVADGSIDPERFELRIVGNVLLPGFSAPAGIELVQTGYVGHERAVAEMRAAGALLLYVHEESLAPSGKLFEYLAAERPVLCVTRPDNRAAQLVTEWGAGIAAAPSDVPAIAAALRTLYRRWEAGALAPADGVRAKTLARYSRRELTRQLSEVLDSALDP